MNPIRHLKEQYRLSMAVKEAMDNLPSAVCYFNPDGSVKLCNRAMYRCYRELVSGEIAAGELQTREDLTRALERCEKCGDVIQNGRVLLFPDGHARQYRMGEIQTEDGRIYGEAVLSDVTELYEKRRQQEQQSAELKQMYQELQSLSERLVEITREQEILHAKTFLHDQMNMGLAAIRQTLRQADQQNGQPFIRQVGQLSGQQPGQPSVHAEGSTKETESAVGQFRRAIRILREETIHSQDDLSEFLRDAEVAGVRVVVQGTLPKEDGALRLLISLMRETCVNAARHGDATEMTVCSTVTEEMVTVSIINNGRPPETEVVPRGGLADLKKRIQRNGGTMEIISRPEVRVTVTLPLNRRAKREENRI